MDKRHEIYVDTCQSSCEFVNDKAQAEECQEKFCPTYVTYLLTGVGDLNVKPSLASTEQREVVQFCAAWILRLLEELTWRYQIRVNFDECVCAAGQDCLVK